MAAQHVHAGGHGHGNGHGLAHTMSLPMLIGVWVALMGLTGLTLVANWALKHGGPLEALGFLEVWVAMIIATVKALLVGLFFMHLLYDKLTNTVFFISSFLFVLLFVALALLDRGQYKPTLNQRMYVPAPVQGEENELSKSSVNSTTETTPAASEAVAPKAE